MKKFDLFLTITGVTLLLAVWGPVAFDMLTNTNPHGDGTDPGIIIRFVGFVVFLSPAVIAVFLIPVICIVSDRLWDIVMDFLYGKRD